MRCLSTQHLGQSPVKDLVLPVLGNGKAKGVQTIPLLVSQKLLGFLIKFLKCVFESFLKNLLN